MPRGAVIININDVPTLIAGAEKKEGKLMVQGITLITKIPGTFYRMSDIVENNIMDCDNRSIELIVQKLKLCRANNLE